MLVRALTPDDAAAFQSLRLFALKHSPEAFASSYEDEVNRSHDYVAERVARTERQAVFGAFDDDRLIGVVGVRRDIFPRHEHKAHIWGMYVAPDNRGAGVSKTLLVEAIAFARGLPGVTHVHLRVAPDNAIAIRLYASLGFEIDESDSDDDVCMRLRIA